MTDYQPTEQDKALLDYAHTAQRRADPWVEFEYWSPAAHRWIDCGKGSPCYQIMRRKPRTVKLSYQGREWEIPASIADNNHLLATLRQCGTDALSLFTDLREIAGGENGK
jgi:hypothetical protein